LLKSKQVDKSVLTKLSEKVDRLVQKTQVQ